MNSTFDVVFPLYPDITQLDFTAPYEVLCRLPGARCTVATVRGGELFSRGLGFSTLRLDEVSRCDLLCVPGGLGTVQALTDTEFLAHVARLGRCARYVSSVCTGSLLLAAAGLLKGKRAACHWAWRELLLEFGVKPDERRVVRDGNTFTGGGVTAGIDLALVIVAEVAGQAFAEGIQLALEYAPEPPFGSGRPETSRESVVAAARERLAALQPARSAAVKQAARRLASVAALTAGAPEAQDQRR